MFLTIAHRGDPLTHPENTLPSLRSAVEKGANTLEFDLRLTKDGRVVLSHDATLERVWGVDVPVAEVTLDELRAHPVDGYVVPTFDEVLAEFRDSMLLVDLKTDEVIEPAVQLLRRTGAFERAIFVAARRGGQQALIKLRSDVPDATIGLDWTAAEPPPQELLDAMRPQYFGPRWRVADAACVPAMRGRGYRVWVGPDVDVPDLPAALAYGVDGIVSDDIGALVRLAATQPGAGMSRRGAG